MMEVFCRDNLSWLLNIYMLIGCERGEGVGEEGWHDPRGQVEELHVPRGERCCGENDEPT